MKKSTLIYTTTLALAAAGLTGAIIATSSATAENCRDAAECGALLAVNTDLTSTKLDTVSSKDETVYLMTDTAGVVKQTFIGNTLYQGSETLPVTLKITYYLDGAVISANDLAGKSGHVKIRYDYTSTKTYQGKYVPFLAITGTILDGDHFSNVSVNNGKMIGENSSLTIVGYSVTGLNSNLNTDLLPTSFEIEADVKDFTLGTTYTLVSNNLLAELDTSKLSTVDDLVASMDKLSSSLDQIITGSSDLKNGLATLVENSNALVDGVALLDSKSDDLTAGADNIYSAVVFPAVSQQLSGNTELMAAIAAQQIAFPLTLENYSVSIPAIIDVLEAKSETLTHQLTQLVQAGYDESSPQYQAVYQGIVTVKTTIASLEGVQNFYDGIYAYTDGVAEFYDHLPALIDGEKQLYDGSVKLIDGLNTFKTEGINKLTSLAHNDIEALANNLRASASAAKSYTNYDSAAATSVKFIYKTPSIK